MLKEDAKAAALKAWRALPAERRQSEQDAAMFAMRIKDDYRFRCSGDRYQVVKGWLITDLDRWPRDVPVMGQVSSGAPEPIKRG